MMFDFRGKWLLKVSIVCISIALFNMVAFADLNASVESITQSEVEINQEMMIPFQETVEGTCGQKKDVKYSRSDLGVVDVLYNSSSSKIKVLITKSGETYTYPIFKDTTYVKFPLPNGDGRYNVAIYENVSGNKYKKIHSKSLSANVINDEAIFLNSIQTINWTIDDSAVVFMNQLIDEYKASLARPEKPVASIEVSKSEIIDLAYNWIVNNISYDYAKIPTLKPDYVPDHVQILALKRGICYDYSSLLGAMLRSQGIPVKLVKGYSAFTDVYHAWNEIYLSEEKRWIVVDTTFDAYMAKAGLEYSMEKSRENYSVKYEY